jgi:putative phosphoesterase
MNAVTGSGKGERVGVISDTHGLLRPGAIEFLRGCSRIIHGGDIGGADLLDELRSLAPLTAVRGNNDVGNWAGCLRHSETIDVDGVRVHAIHDLKKLEIDPRERRIRVIVSGHSHKPSIDERDGILFLNPGSAGPRRFKLPISIGELLIAGGTVTARVIELERPETSGAGRARHQNASSR